MTVVIKHSSNKPAVTYFLALQICSSIYMEVVKIIKSNTQNYDVIITLHLLSIQYQNIPLENVRHGCHGCNQPTGLAMFYIVDGGGLRSLFPLSSQLPVSTPYIATVELTTYSRAVLFQVRLHPNHNTSTSQNNEVRDMPEVLC